METRWKKCHDFPFQGQGQKEEGKRAGRKFGKVLYRGFFHRTSAALPKTKSSCTCRFECFGNDMYVKEGGTKKNQEVGDAFCSLCDLAIFFVQYIYWIVKDKDVPAMLGFWIR